MIQIYIDGELVSDSRREGYELEGLSVTRGLNKGGVATIKLPITHPAYTKFRPYKSIIELRRDGVLKFRGRPLPASEDMYNVRTVTCEGELCFFNDTVVRPYLYQDSPKAIFSDLISLHNLQVSTEKQFYVGEITVVDANDYVRLESERAEQTLDTIYKLIDRCGGYIIFTTGSDGQRVINWYSELTYRSNQVLEFGSNLMDFSRSGNSTLATAVLPYGKKDTSTGERVTIGSVNGGIDYILDEEAVEIYGLIAKPVYWDDVSEPSNLLTKARAWLDDNKVIVHTLKLTAIDLSLLDKSIDTYDVGDMIPARSKPHGLDDDFLLTEKTEDWLIPDGGSIVLGKDVQTLTGSDVTAGKQASNSLSLAQQAMKDQIKNETAGILDGMEQGYATKQSVQALALQIENFVTDAEVEKKLQGYISNSDLTESEKKAADTYATKDEVEGLHFRTEWLELGSGMFCKLHDGFCTVRGSSETVNLDAAGVILCTLPVECRPDVELIGALAMIGGGQYSINTEGIVSAKAYTENATGWAFCLTYPINTQGGAEDGANY